MRKAIIAAIPLGLLLLLPTEAPAIQVHQHHEKKIVKATLDDKIVVDSIEWVEVVNVAPPDSDDDGVMDSADECPQSAGSLDNGCNPEPTITTTTPTNYSGGTPVYSGGAPLESIASCESGGDPTAISPDGTYRGKYQFDYGTWASVGGSGDPAAASEQEQDYRAGLLYANSGSSPWPICGS